MISTQPPGDQLRNFELSGNGAHLRTMLDSTHRITRSGKIRRTRFRRIFESVPVLTVRQMLVELTFPLRKRLGLRRKTLDKVRGVPSNPID